MSIVSYFFKSFSMKNSYQCYYIILLKFISTNKEFVLTDKEFSFDR